MIKLIPNNKNYDNISLSLFQGNISPIEFEYYDIIYNDITYTLEINLDEFLNQNENIIGEIKVFISDNQNENIIKKSHL